MYPAGGTKNRGGTSEFGGETGNFGIEIGESEAKLFAIALVDGDFQALLHAHTGEAENFVLPPRRKLLRRWPAFLSGLFSWLALRFELLNLPLD